jgi:ABC-2 type transport system ATP-binding protein
MSIQVDSLRKTFGKQIAVDNVSFKIEKNEIVGFIGPNGAGKSTTMKMICGLLEPDSGSVYVNGNDALKNAMVVKKKLGYLPESNPLYAEMYVREFLEFNLQIHKIKKSKARIDDLIERTGLGREQHKIITTLSKGYKQRVGLAQALIGDPDVLILDEPTTGLDPNQIIEIRTLIQELGKEKTVLLSTHLMQEVEAICGRVIIINNGKIEANERTSEIKETRFNNIQTIRIEFDKEMNVSDLLSITPIENIKEISTFEFLMETKSSEDIRPLLFEWAVSKSVKILSMQKENKSLEDVFQLITKNN